MKIKPLYHLAEAASFTMEILPTWFSYSIASFVGDVIFFSWPRIRRNLTKAVANLLNSSDNDSKVRKISRQCTRNFCKYVVDVFRYAHPREGFFEKNFKISGRENVDKSLAEGKGIILVSFHLGNLDMGVRILSANGYKVSAIVDNLQIKQLDTILQESRSLGGAQIISVKAASHMLLDILRRNEILALMLDNPHCLKGVKAKLGQKWVLFPSGAATMAIRTGARVVPCAVVRISNTNFHAIAGKPIEYQPSGDLTEDIRIITQKMVTALEELTRQYIDQWYVFHPMIKDELQ